MLKYRRPEVASLQTALTQRRRLWRQRRNRHRRQSGQRSADIGGHKSRPKRLLSPRSVLAPLGQARRVSRGCGGSNVGPSTALSQGKSRTSTESFNFRPGDNLESLGVRFGSGGSIGLFVSCVRVCSLCFSSLLFGFASLSLSLYGSFAFCCS